MMTDEQFAKLPSHARNELARLRADIAAAKKRLERTLVPAEDDRPAYGDYDERRGMGLPCRTVRFPHYGIDVRVGPEGVQIHGDGQLSVLPSVSNVITVVSTRVDAG